MDDQRPEFVKSGPHGTLGSSRKNKNASGLKNRNQKQKGFGSENQGSG